MTEKRIGLIASAVLGLVLGVIACAAFGILDVQCWGDAPGPFWSAETQTCGPSK